MSELIDANQPNDMYKFLSAVQARAARIAVGPSAVRRQGKGCAKAAREFFESLDLARFDKTTDIEFQKTLNDVTKELQSALPGKSSSWGLARKLLNIFLRDALYTVYLKNAYKLDQIKSFLEVPLDSITARNIKCAADRRALPVWPGVKNLPPALSERFQASAETEAKRQGVARVHLDAFWWGQRKI
jgi:hypothetical protein